jgi:hypothetical protein
VCGANRAREELGRCGRCRGAWVCAAAPAAPARGCEAAHHAGDGCKRGLAALLAQRRAEAAEAKAAEAKAAEAKAAEAKTAEAKAAEAKAAEAKAAEAMAEAKRNQDDAATPAVAAPRPAPAAQACSGCGRAPDAGAGAFNLCGGCRVASYCSAECQRAQWPAHKAACKAAAQGARDKAARAALGPAEARAKGEQLLEAAFQAWLIARGEAAKPFIADALRLISEGADLDCVDGAGRSSLMYASFFEALDGVSARLIAAGAKLDHVNKDGDSALILACFNKRAATALLLVEAGAALNQDDTYGKARSTTPTRRASRPCRPPSARAGGARPRSCRASATRRRARRSRRRWRGRRASGCSRPALAATLLLRCGSSARARSWTVSTGTAGRPW